MAAASSSKNWSTTASTLARKPEIAPVIKVTITTGKARKPTRIVIEDNGPGIPADTITGIIDYNVRVSSREAYISPTRGRQGNALKTILPMAYVLGGKVQGRDLDRGARHQAPHPVQRQSDQAGADRQEYPEPFAGQDRNPRHRVLAGRRGLIDVDEISELLTQFIWVNPHLTLQFTVDGKTLIDLRATNPDWTKYRACDATSAHWYTLEQFERYAGALIARDQEQRRATRQKIHGQGIHCAVPGHERDREAEAGFARTRRVAHVAASVLWFGDLGQSSAHGEAAAAAAAAHPAGAPGIARRHRRGAPAADCASSAGGEPQELQIFRSAPVTTPTACRTWSRSRPVPTKNGSLAKKKRGIGMLITGVNFSATLENPFETFKGMEGMEEILAELRAGQYAPVIVCVHYACPHIEYLDRGKSRIGLE